MKYKENMGRRVVRVTKWLGQRKAEEVGLEELGNLRGAGRPAVKGQVHSVSSFDSLKERDHKQQFLCSDSLLLDPGQILTFGTHPPSLACLPSPNHLGLIKPGLLSSQLI